MMRALTAKLALIGVLLLGAQYSHAGLFGWTTTITATDGGNTYSQYVSAPNYHDCEIARQNAINYFLSLGYTITSQPFCTLLALIDFDRLIVLERQPKWPWPGPVCLSCPYLTLDNIKIIYPDYAEQAQELVQKYNIEAYNEALLKLQKEFDLEQFEQEMFGLELEQQIGK